MTSQWLVCLRGTPLLISRFFNYEIAFVDETYNQV